MSNRRNDIPCFLYGLLDPRTATIFYIGISVCPQDRLPQHKSDPASAAHRRYQQIIKAELQPQLVVLWQCRDRDHARQIERLVVGDFPALTNRNHNKCAA